MKTTTNTLRANFEDNADRLYSIGAAFARSTCPILLLLALALNASGSATETVATGLNNPRGLNFGPEGALYVAEAGSGGTGPCGPGEDGTRCYGASSSITRLDLRRRTQERFSTGFPSLALPDGTIAVGAHDIAFQGRGHAQVTIGFGGNPQDRKTHFGAPGAQLAGLARVAPKGDWKLTSDLGAYEVLANPAGDEIDSNPYGLLLVAGKQIVADAGANALIQIDANGNVSTLAAFADRMVDAPPFLELPPGTQIPMESVPTAVALGPDGAYYVAELTGFPFPVGGANVYRVPVQGGTPNVFAAGFTSIIDIAFGPDGSLYVLEIAKNGLLEAFGGGDWTGALIQVAPDGTRTEIASDGLFAPGGVALGDDGAFYITNNSIFSGTGTVLKIVRSASQLRSGPGQR